jgi:hypothetical protein
VIALLGFGADAIAQEYVTVEKRRSPAGTVLRDTISGGLLGAAVGGAVIGYEMGIQDNEDYNWERTLAIGAAVGLGVGLIYGIVDATTGFAMQGSPVRAHDGLSMSLNVRRADQSGLAQVPLVAGRF